MFFLLLARRSTLCEKRRPWPQHCTACVSSRHSTGPWRRQSHNDKLSSRLKNMKLTAQLIVPSNKIPNSLNGLRITEVLTGCLTVQSLLFFLLLFSPFVEGQGKCLYFVFYNLLHHYLYCLVYHRTDSLRNYLVSL